MASKKHVARLRQGVEAWNQWRRENPNIRPDLSGAILIRANLSGADLRRTNLIDADLSHADLCGAQMARAKLSQATLRGAELIAADLRRVDLRHADLFGANLSGADLSEANLNGADLNYANLHPTPGLASKHEGAPRIGDQGPAPWCQPFVNTLALNLSCPRLRREGTSPPVPKAHLRGSLMHCYFNLVSPHQSIIDEEGIAVADADEARTFAREAVTEMVQDGMAEIAHWRGWEIEARDASGTILFKIGFGDLLSAEGERAEAQAGVAVSFREDRTYDYDEAA